MNRSIVFLFAVGMTACSTTPTPSLPADSEKPEAVDTTAVVAGNSQFAFDLFRKLAEKEHGNLFFSPYSISAALAMTSVGARGETLQEMQKTLAFPEDEKLHPGFRYLDWELNGEPASKRGYQLVVSNLLWGQKGYPWKKEFLATTGKFYKAGLQEVDFRTQPDDARKTINSRIEKQTNDKIKELLPQKLITSLTRLVLTNAIYFKGDWASQFKKDRTDPAGIFHLNATQMLAVPMMNQKAKFVYADDRTAQVVRLPYVGKELEMVVVLPRKVDGLAEVEKEMTAKKLQGWIDAGRARTVALTFPKFKMESDLNLGKQLELMGMKRAFDDMQADFTGMATVEQLFIGAVIHKAFVEVSEEGTEAAAATAVVIETKDGGPRREEEVVFRADHPFLFLIRDTRNGSILFLGRFVRT